jgi:hypothetical protein
MKDSKGVPPPTDSVPVEQAIGYPRRPVNTRWKKEQSGNATHAETGRYFSEMSMELTHG